MHFSPYLAEPCLYSVHWLKRLQGAQVFSGSKNSALQC
jgi:hypothetical protein